MELDEEIQKTRDEINRLTEIDKKSTELKQLKAKLNQLTFRNKHKKLYNTTMSLERGTKRFFKAFGSGLKKTGKALEKSDEYIAREKAKERELMKNKKSNKEVKKRSMLEEAGDIDG